MSRKNIRKLTISEALQYMQQLSDDESENGSCEDIVFSDEEYVPLNQECLSTDDDEDDDDKVSVSDVTVFSEPCRNKENTPPERKKQRPNKRKNMTDSRQDLVNNETLVSNDGTHWSSIDVGSCVRGRISSHNIYKEMHGPTSYTKRNIEDGHASTAWRLLIDASMLRNIKNCTEAEAHRQLGKNEWSTSLEELDAFISILYARGIYGAKSMELDSLWSVVWGPPFFRATMSRDRFRDIMRYLRFDKKTTRSQRLQIDKFGLISEIWNKFIENSINCYKPGPFVTIDEQLFPSKARCRFTQYMPNKPDKFGIKFWLAADVDSKYVLNGFPYLGKDDQRPGNITLSEYVVLRLIEPFENKGIHVTTDNFFTTLKLSEMLMAKKTSLTGTMKRNRREIPEFVKKIKMPLYNTLLLKHDDTTLTVYQGKKHKNVLVLSSLHPTVDVDNNDPKKLPETISFYNSTKFGVDVADQMARKYSVKAGSRRWPVHVFYNILDLAGINSWILYKETTGKSIKRKEFLQQLIEELRSPYVTRDQMKNSDIKRKNTEESTANQKRVRCQYSRCSNKTVDKCSSCSIPICGKCTKNVKRICPSCT